MRVTIPMLEDLGLCGAGLEEMTKLSQASGITEWDYDQGVALFLSMEDYLREAASKVNDPEHDNYDGWLKFTLDLKNRAEAITYFGDHIVEELYRTPDGYTYNTLQEAKDHVLRQAEEQKTYYQETFSILGVKINEQGHEVWQTIDINNVDLSEYDDFVWHDQNTGLNNKTSSPTAALVFIESQKDILRAIDESAAKAVIKQKITDSSGQYSVWVDV